jgi:hypothetical protein
MHIPVHLVPVIDDSPHPPAMGPSVKESTGQHHHAVAIGESGTFDKESKNERKQKKYNHSAS